MGKIRLIARLVGRDLRRRPGPALLLVLAITAATATLTLGLVLHGVTSQPYQQTQAATHGPDVVALISGESGLSAAQAAAEVRTLSHAAGVTGYNGPFPVASAVLRYRGLTEGVAAEGRAEAPASVDRPKVLDGTWVRPGGIVLERTFAEALGVGVGGRVTLNDRSFRVVGIAVTAAVVPYPNMCGPAYGCVFSRSGPNNFNPGLAWVTEPAARSLASAQAPLSYLLNLKLKDPATAPAFVSEHPPPPVANSPVLSWQTLEAGYGSEVHAEQTVLTPAAWLAGLLAIASVAVLAGGRMAERTRRVGLLKAVGGTPRTVTVVLLAENLVLALTAAAAGLAIGWGVGPLLSSPGAALVGTPGAPAFSLSIAGLVVAVALVVALASTLVPAIRAARTSTVSALADAARRPRRHGVLIRLSRGLPVPMLLGMRLIARRPRRAVLSTASVAVTAGGIVAVLAFHATVHLNAATLSNGLGNPMIDRDEQILTVMTVVLVALAILNAICAAWTTVLDARHSSALARALGATPGQVTAGIAAAQVLPAVPGVLLGIPLGIGLYSVAVNGIGIIVPPVWWLAAAVLGTLAAIAALAAIPALADARRPVSPILQSETA
jgi:putative ABC transport system permease protein